MRLIYLGGAWVAGIYLGSKFVLPLGAGLPALLLSLTVALLFCRKKALLLAGLCLAAFLGGMLRFPSTAPVSEHQLQFYNSQVVQIRGVVASAPEPGDEATCLRLSADETRLKGGGGEWGTRKKVEGDALVWLARYPSYSYGDVLLVEGRLEAPPQFEGFDYRGYLARQGIGSTMRYPRVELVGEGRGFAPLGWLYRLRGGLSQALAEALPEPQGSLAQGILLGIRSHIPDPVNEAFSRSGTAHVLAISGLNIGIVAGMVVSLGAWALGRRRPTYILLAFAAIWGYTLITGMQPSAVRAAIMGSLFLAAEGIGRPGSAFTSLAVAAAIMVGLQPQLLWDVAFQLSFLAMAGIGLLSPPLRGSGRGLVVKALGEEGWAVRLAAALVDGLAITLGAIIATWPLIAYNFGIVSLVALPANLLILPVLPGIIITSALVAGAGLLWPLLAEGLGWVAWPFITHMIEVVEALGRPSLASLQVDSIGGSMVWGYYVLGAVIWIGHSRRRLASLISSAVRLRVRAGAAPKPLRWAALLGVVAILVWAAVLIPAAPDRLEVEFLDVGQGDAILIETPSQHRILVDGGPSAEAIGLELGRRLPFWDRGFDLVVLTHPDADHLAGLVEVLSRYRVEQVLEPGLPSSSPLYEEWLRLVREKGIERTLARAGQRLELGEGGWLEVLHPQHSLVEGTTSDDDNNSVVLRLAWGEVSFLLAGDIYWEGEWELLAQGVELESTVLKVGHHGSGGSTSPRFLAAVAPQVAVVSVGAENPYELPDPGVVDRLQERLGGDRIYITAERGTIELATDGERLWLGVGR